MKYLIYCVCNLLYFVSTLFFRDIVLCLIVLDRKTNTLHTQSNLNNEDTYDLLNETRLLFLDDKARRSEEN